MVAGRVAAQGLTAGYRAAERRWQAAAGLAAAKLGISTQTSSKGGPMSYSGAKDQADRAMTKAAEAGRSTDDESQRLLAEAVGHLAMALSAIALELQHSE
jgi:hypothetical protein